MVDCHDLRHHGIDSSWRHPFGSLDTDSMKGFCGGMSSDCMLDLVMFASRCQ